MGTGNWFGKGVADLLKAPQQDMADALSYTVASTTPPTTATQAQMAAQSSSLTSGMLQQALNTQYQPGMQAAYAPYQQWIGTSGTSPMQGQTPWSVKMDESNEPEFKKDLAEFRKEVELEFADLHNKLDKMYEILQGLVKVEIPADEIRKALAEEPPF
jgi:hypothetical protein